MGRWHRGALVLLVAASAVPAGADYQVAAVDPLPGALGLVAETIAPESLDSLKPPASGGPDCLMLAPGPQLSADAAAALDSYLRGGGDLVLLGPEAAGLAETIHYLYAFANGYAGAIKWMSSDWPVPIIRRQAEWLKGQPDRQLLEGRLGMYYYDGTPEGRPKPIVHALRFLRDYADAGQSGGRLRIRRAANRIGTAYTYRGDGALFVGDGSYSSPELGFSVRDGRVASVMVTWDGSSLSVMATHDADVSLRPARLVPGPVDGLRVEGRHGGARIADGQVRVTLLAGERVRVAHERP